jgi:subtilase family serine protease
MFRSVACVLGLHRFLAVRRLGFARLIKYQTFLAAAFLSIAFISSAAAPVTSQPQVLRGHVPRITRKLSPLGRLDAGYHLEVAIGLPLRNREQLTNVLADIYNPSSPNFRHFLSADEFAASFGPSAEDYQSVIDFAKAHHLTVTQTHPNRTLVHVSGSVADIENAFHVHMQTFKHPKENRIFFAPDAEPSLDLKTPVLAISGLDNYVKPRPHLHSAAPSPRIRPMGGGGGGGGGGSNTGPFEGSDFRDVYAAGLSQDGTGQSVGLFELFGYSDQDIRDYEDEIGLFSYVTVQPVLIDGAGGNDANVDWADNPGYLDYSFEVTGDIEQTIAMAPGLSSILVYEGPTPQDVPPLGSNYVQDAVTTDQINDVLNRMATDNLAKQLSCSYGFDINLSTVQIFQQYAAQGQSFFLASGDGGAFSSAVDEPADDPNITLVGGTTLTMTSSGDWGSEVVWLTPPGNDGFGDATPLEASGGGISTVYSIPWWQQGISMTANQGSTTMRNVPDVSAVANNLNIVWGNDFIGSSSDWTEAGTSLAAPLWAGFMAMVNQQAAANGQPPIGFANPALYAIGKSASYRSNFHDITVGSNTNNSSPTKFNAVSGYDLCTGWGTMIGSNLMQALLAPPAETLRITSSLGFTSEGPSGGPFSVTGQTYNLVNTGAIPLTWSLANTSSWLTASSTGGTLNPGGSANVTVSLNANANNFLITHATGNVGFNNLTAGTTQNRQFDLYVGNGGFENGDLSDWTYVGDTTLTFALAGDDADVAGEEALPGQPDELFVHSGIYGGYLGQWPNNGTLSQTVPTIAGQQLLVSFWLTSVPDQNGETTPNGFVAKWNGSTLFTATNLPVFGWTNMQYIVPSAGASGTIEFDFNNTPGAFGLDDVTVGTVPPPVLNPPVASAGNITLGWNAFVNQSYQIQSTTNLGGSGWTNQGSPILATNTVMSVSLPINNASGQFYRVIMSPQ